MTEKDLKNLAQEYLKATYGKDVVFWFPTRLKWQNDIFGVFDFIYIIGGFEVRFVQMTTVPHRSERLNKILTWLKNNHLELFYTAELWLWDKTYNKWIIRLVDDLWLS